MLQWEQLYYRLLESKKVLEKVKGVETHHITPKHDKGTNDSSNLVYLPRRYHTLAHYIRWRWLGQGGDRVAYLNMSGRSINPMFDADIHRKHTILMNTPEIKHKLSTKAKERFSKEGERGRASKRRLEYTNSLEDKSKISKHLHTKEGREVTELGKKRWREANPELSRSHILEMSLKAVEATNKKKINMTLEEVRDYYSRGSGINNPNWKGYYVLESKTDRMIFDSIKDLRAKTGLSVKLIGNVLNKGIAISSKRSKCFGYTLSRTLEGN